MKEMVICRALRALGTSDVRQYASGRRGLTVHRHLSHFLHATVHPIRVIPTGMPRRYRNCKYQCVYLSGRLNRRPHSNCTFPRIPKLTTPKAGNNFGVNGRKEGSV